MIWYRIDNRLVHGQIIEAWLPHINAQELLIANDELFRQDLRQQIMLMAVPQRVRTLFLCLESLPAGIENSLESRHNVLVLFENCKDMLQAFELGVPINICNVGNLHYAPGKKQICQHVAVSAEDEKYLRFFEDKGIELDFRCIPADTPEIRGW